MQRQSRVASHAKQRKSRYIHSLKMSRFNRAESNAFQCDEALPTCFRCRRNSRQCTYEPVTSYGPKSKALTFEANLTKNDAFSVLSGVTLVPSLGPKPKNGISPINLIQHFQRQWVDIFNFPCSEEILRLSKSDALVRNTMLAMAASHLRHVSPGNQQYLITELFQQSLALQDYQKALAMPIERLGQSGVDSLLLSAVLLNILAFALPACETTSSVNDRPDPSTSWVFSSHVNQLGWLVLQAGLRPLMKSMGPYFDKTMKFLALTFLGSENETWVVLKKDSNLEHVPDAWIKVFELDSADRSGECKTMDCTDPTNLSNDWNSGGLLPNLANVYHLPAMVLLELRKLEPVSLNLFKNLQFLGKVQHELRVLLYARDERALWLLGYWLGLMCRFEGTSKWWCDKRAKRDYQGICMWLEQLRLAKRPGIDGKRWSELMEDLRMAPSFFHEE